MGVFKSYDIRGVYNQDWDKDLDDLFKEETKPVATRSASGVVLNALVLRVCSLVGGSADLSPQQFSE